MNKSLTYFIIGAVTLSSVATSVPVFAKNDNNKGKSENSKSASSVVNFIKSDDDSDKSRIKVLTNKNLTKIQTVGPSKLKNNLELKFKWHEGSDDLKIKVPKGTMTSSSEAFVAAVKTAYTQYKASMATAKQTFLTAIAAARAQYLASSTPATNTAPTVAVVATANPSPVNGTTTTLSVLGADNNGEGNLIYTWSVTNKPTSAADPSFSTNGSNAAKTTVATFSSAGSYTFQVVIKDAGNLTVTSSVSVTVNINNAPTVATAANANPSPINGTTTTLSVLGADDGGEAALNYTWTTTAKPTGASNPTFSVNGNNAAKSTIATFTSAGSYTFEVTITDANSLSVVSAVSVTVNQTLTSVNVSPTSTTMSPGSSTVFTASAFDQFSLAKSESFSWSIFEGSLGGIFNSTTPLTATYVAPMATGTYHVVGSTGGKSATSTITVQ